MASTPQQVAQIIASRRLDNAMRLAEILEARGFTSDMVKKMSDHGWHIVHVTAKTRKAPSEDTKQLVLRIVRWCEAGNRKGDFKE